MQPFTIIFMPDFPAIRLAVPTRVAAAFDHPDWIFELKHDGFRALGYITDGRCNLVSRENNFYKSFGPLREALAGFRGRYTRDKPGSWSRSLRDYYKLQWLPQLS